MKKRKQMLALLLSLVLAVSLCACDSANGDASADPDASPTIEVDLTQDAVKFSTGLSVDDAEFSTGLSADDVLLTVNGEDVTADLFFYVLYEDCNWILSQYYYTYWSLPNSLEPYTEMLLDDTSDMLVYHTILRQKAAELGCVLTDEQRAEAEAAKTGENLEFYERHKAAYSLTDESMDFLVCLDYYYDNLLGTIPMPSADRLDDYVYQTKHILLMTVERVLQDNGTYAYVALPDETVAEKRALAEDILARLRAVEGEEQLELFDELMEEYSEDGRNAGGHIDTAGYEAVLGEMVPDYEQGSLALDFGEISDIVESYYGYHIILRQEVEFREATAEEYMEDYRVYLLEQKIQEWVSGATVTRADALLAGVDIDSFFDRYYAYFTAVQAQYEADGAD